MSLVKIRRAGMTIEWIDDPDASFYQVPCDGCPDYCDREDIDDATGEDFGGAYCEGQSLIRRTTRWQAILEFTCLNDAGIELCLTSIGFGQSEDEALLAAEVNFVARRLREDPFTQPSLW